MPSVEKITIALTTEQAGFVRQAVQVGEYASTSEVIREAVREWKERRDLLGYSVEELRRLVQKGIDSGSPIDATEAFAEIRAKIKAQPDLA